jgi:hypothetical protein
MLVYHGTHACVYMCVLSNSPSKYARKHLMGIMKKNGNLIWLEL